MESYPERFKRHARAGKEAMDLTHPFKGGLRKPDGEYNLDVPAPTPPPPPPEGRDPPKSVAIATVLGIIPGLGHIYLRRIIQGAAIFVIFVVMLALYFLIIPAIIAAFVWGWSIYSANRAAKRYNRVVEETGRRPQ